MGGASAGIGAGVGGLVGGIFGPRITGRTKRSSDRILQGGQIENTFSNLEYLLTPYDELVAQGRLDPGQSFFGLEGQGMGGQSRISRGISNYEDSLAAGDPNFAAYKKYIGEQSKALATGELPSDLQNNILRDVRGSQAARGVLDSDTSSIQEAIQLLGGREALRQQRLSSVQDYLNGIMGGAMGTLMPSISELYQGELSRTFKRQEGMLHAVDTGVGFANSSMS